MSKIDDPLGTTAQDLHRVWFTISTLEQWYAIMQECRIAFGSNWRGQSKVRKKLEEKNRHSQMLLQQHLEVWFDVPDTRMATWISIKLGIRAVDHKKSHK